MHQAHGLMLKIARCQEPQAGQKVNVSVVNKFIHVFQDYAIFMLFYQIITPCDLCVSSLGWEYNQTGRLYNGMLREKAVDVFVCLCACTHTHV